MTTTTFFVMSRSFLVAVFFLFVFAFVVQRGPMAASALLPTAEIHIFGTTTKEGHYQQSKILLASEALYGPRSPMIGRTAGKSKSGDNHNDRHRMVVPPGTNPLLCDDSDFDSNGKADASVYANAIVLVPRGECTYMHKTLAAQKLGASAVLVYNTLASRYTVNTTSHAGERYPAYSSRDIVWPLSQHDYDCQRGTARIPAADLSFDPLPYNAPHNDPLLGGRRSGSGGSDSDSLCRLYSDDNLRQCSSQRCLVAHDQIESEGQNKNKDNSTLMVCCAWDLHLEPAGDYALMNYSVNIPTLFVTMAQGDELLDLVEAKSNAEVAVYARWQPAYNLSALLIWVLGVTVCAIAAYLSASEYHKGIARYLKRMATAGAAGGSSRQQERPPSQQQMVPRANSMQEETLELEPIHAVGFVIMASTSLLVLFYFKIYAIVKVMYAFGCSNAVIQVITYPLLSKLLSSKFCRRRTPGSGASEGNNHPQYSYYLRERILYRSEDLGDITNWDAMAALIGYAWGMTWLYMALFTPHASDTSTFFWVTQDVLGACMCITFLGLIQLNSIQVASILLVVAFFYDIFFVFISPLIFSKSVMITVATSGGPPKAGPLWCEKYPSDKDCQGGDPLPMLLTIPKLFDYEAGSSLLGLGDIVLPGLLLSFAARLDAAKYLVALAGGNGKNGTQDARPIDEADDNVETGQEEHDGIMTTTTTVRPTTGNVTMRRLGASSTTSMVEAAAAADIYTHPNVHQSQSAFYSSWLCCLCAWFSYHCCGGAQAATESAWHALLFGNGGYYFGPLVVAYAVGLLMANMAVYLMQMGQPALLYLVPCTLGTMCYLGWRRQELRSLWEGPKVLVTADDIVFGRQQRPTSRQQVPTQETQSSSSMSPTTSNLEDGMGGGGGGGGGDHDHDDEEEDADEGDVPLLATKTGGAGGASGLVE